MTAYATGHGGSYPWDPIELASAKLIQFSDLGTPGRLPYRYEGRDLKVPLPADLIVMYEEGVRDRKRTVLFGDGRVETIDIGNWEKMLDDSHKLLRKVRGRR